MQFITHRDPVAQSGWATALGATGDAVNNLLGIYSNYKNQQLEQKRYEREQARIDEELAMRKAEADRQAAHQDLMTQLQLRQLRLQEQKEGRPGSRPVVETGKQEVKVRDMSQLVAPAGPKPLDLGEFTPDANKPDAAKTGAPEPKPDQTVDMTMFGLAPTQYERVAEIRDRSGNVLAPSMEYEVKYEDEIRAQRDKEALDRAVTTGQMVRLSEGERALRRAHGLGDSEYMPDDAYRTFVQSVMTPEKPKDPFANVQTVAGGYLTTDDKGNIVFHRTEQDKGTGDAGKPLIATEAAKIHDFRSGLGQLSNLLDEAAQTGTSAWVKTKTPGLFGEMFGWGNDAKSRQAALDTAKQIIGKAMEGGVLRKEDEVKYMRILPVIKDPPDVARNKIKNLVDTMIRDADLYLETLEGAGRNVSGVRPLIERSAREAALAVGGGGAGTQTRSDDAIGILDDKQKTISTPNRLGLRPPTARPPATGRRPIRQ